MKYFMALGIAVIPSIVLAADSDLEYPKLTQQQLRIGQFGYLRNCVKQRTGRAPVGVRGFTRGSAGEFPARITADRRARERELASKSYSFLVVQVISKNECLIERGNEVIWVKGIGTKAIVDGRYYGFPGLFKISGTKKYTTASGTSKTVLVAETHVPTPEDQEAIQRQYEEQKEAVKAQKIAAAKQQKALAKSREWTSKNGKFNTRAEFIEYVKGKVKLRKIDGKIIEVSMVRLSSPDQKWVRAELKKRRAKKETAPKN